MKRLVIIFPFYAGDRAAAMKLARFVTDIEPTYRDDVELCFVNRWDCDPIYPGEMMKFVTTFKISWFASTTKADGHPAGPNAMAKDIFNEALRRSNVGQPWADVDALLLMEPDCVPVALDWINRLRTEWEIDMPGDALVLGCHRFQNVDVPHVNGNALWRPRLASFINVEIDCHGFGWDSAWAEQIGKRFVNTSLIENLFKETDVSEYRMQVNPFAPEQFSPPVLIHGVKDLSAWDYAHRTMKI